MNIIKTLTQNTATKLALLALALSVSAFAFGGSAHADSGAATRFRTLEEAVAAGALDADLVTGMRESGVAEGLVSFEHQALLDSAAAEAPQGNGRAAAILDKVQPAFAAKKAHAFGGAPGEIEVLETFDNLATSFVLFRSEKALLRVLNAPDVTAIGDNEPVDAALPESTKLIRQPEVQALGKTGAGTYVAVLDTGVDFTRPQFGSCTAPNVPTTCKVGVAWDAAPEDNNRDDYAHGTHVAGIVVGVAPGTRIAAIDVFQWYYDAQAGKNKISAFPASLAKAINWVIGQKRLGHNYVAMNLSLGSGFNTGACSDTSDGHKLDFATASALGVLPVVASGNSAYDAPGQVGTFKAGIGWPACVPGALSVGAVYDKAYGTFNQNSCSDNVTAAGQLVCFSQSSSNLSMLAPGSWITSAGPGSDGAGGNQGTSMAAPHVAGAAAVLAAAKPGASLAQIESALKNTGPLVTDNRLGAATKRRLDLYAAYNALAGDTTKPVVTAPSSALVEGSTLNSATGVPANGLSTRLSWSASDTSGIAKFELHRMALSPIGAITWVDEPLSSATATSKVLTLAPGNHTFRVRATDGAGNVSDFVSSTFTAELKQESAGTITGSWYSQARSGASGGAIWYATAANASYSLTFTGRSIAWVAPKSFDRGRANVFIDGVWVKTVDLNSVSTLERQVVFAKSFTTSATRTLKIVVEGTIGHPYVTVDAFEVIK